jgi:triacylglycerol lipase
MGRTAFSMNSMASYIEKHGYQVISHNYPSTSQTIEQIAKKIIPQFVNECHEDVKKIHFVTHSLGGIITRYYLQTNPLPSGSRVVMLSPPNKGSEIADRFHDSLWYRWLTGPPGQQLTTAANSLPNRLGAIDYEIGVITGKNTIEPWFSRLIPGEDDGKVSIESAKLPEIKDFLVVDHTHTFIMKSNEVKRQVLNFIRYGNFTNSNE